MTGTITPETVYDVYLTNFDTNADDDDECAVLTEFKTGATTEVENQLYPDCSVIRIDLDDVYTALVHVLDKLAYHGYNWQEIRAALLCGNLHGQVWQYVELRPRSAPVPKDGWDSWALIERCFKLDKNVKFVETTRWELGEGPPNDRHQKVRQLLDDHERRELPASAPHS